MPAAPSIKLSSPVTHEFWEIPVLFEDEHLLALDKPPGLLTSPDRLQPERPNLTALLHEAIAQGKPWAKMRGVGYLTVAHRADAETSGVLLLARSKPVLNALADLFNSGKLKQRFTALVQGQPEREAWEVDSPLAAHHARPGLMRIDPKRGKRARTRFTVLEKFRGYALLRAEPVPHRQHQVRVHLRHAGLPVCGDPFYGGSPLLLSRLKSNYRLKPGQTERPLISAAAVHLEEVELAHPVTGAPLRISAPWPKDLNVAVKYLKRYAAA